MDADPGAGVQTGPPCAFYGVTGEAALVAEIIGTLARGPIEVNSLSSKYAVQFNEVVRGAEDTPFNPQKRNDGSFKKWILACGFEVGPVFERNRSFVSLPVATGGREACPAVAGRRTRGQRGHHRGPRGAARTTPGASRWEVRRCGGQDLADDAVGPQAAGGAAEDMPDSTAPASARDTAVAQNDSSHEVGVEDNDSSIDEFVVVGDADVWTEAFMESEQGGLVQSKPTDADASSEGMDSDVEIVDVQRL
mmetsp:Transcript_24119/g.63654  ORF Transcript_24119/g.63654 Transcript_24119/m.63654 type:complete len:250 (+) Transcript_24119:91-840(+)